MIQYFADFSGKKWGFRQICSTLIFTAVFCFLITGNSNASAEMFIYPAQGQSAEQLNREKFECHEWAKQQTGVDPNRLAADVQPMQVEQRGGAFRGAARGAAVGAIGGAIGGDAGKGAAIGAGAGALMGNRRRRQSEHEQMRAYEEANQQRKALMDTFNRAYRTCLEGRGYTVN
ncbi:MAG: glycine zipper domain-containing protein [Candidatus Scalindua sp.]|nr:glycine zipper domain-containing protein [Candidatus Scalindua sp.]